MLRRWLLVMTAVLGGTLTACSHHEEAAARPYTYAAVGASETVGVGAGDPKEGAWTAVLARTALPSSTTFVNVGISGATVKDAIDRELAKALDAKPRLVTVWLNVNDLIKLVSAPDYERDLERLVKALRQGGQADVLVANTPPVELLPVVRACLPGAPEAGAGAGAVKCPLPVRVPESLIVNQVDAYNQAIARVVQRQGAILVDLHAAGRASWSPSLVAADGFHPSTEGHRKVAEAFAAAVPPALRR